MKPISTPQKILSLEAILRRIRSDHPSREKILKDLGLYKSGYYGEQSLNYFLKQLPNNDYYIFHNLRIKIPTVTFQIDFLILSKKFILILEVKNLTGHLKFEEEHAQLIQSKTPNEIKVYNDPVIQVSEHRRNLIKFLSKYNLQNIPVQYLVVITNPNAYITIDSKCKEYRNSIIRSNILLQRIFKTDGHYQKEHYTSKDIKKSTKIILAGCEESYPNILTDYSIDKSEFINGVICENCGFLPMKRINSLWLCPVCNTLSNTGHINALNDYSFLIGNTINNNEIRSLLCIDSPKIAHSLINKLDIQTLGSNKSRTYLLPPSGFNS